MGKYRLFELYYFDSSIVIHIDYSQYIGVNLFYKELINFNYLKYFFIIYLYFLDETDTYIDLMIYK